MSVVSNKKIKIITKGNDSVNIDIDILGSDVSTIIRALIHYVDYSKSFNQDSNIEQTICFLVNKIEKQTKKSSLRKKIKNVTRIISTRNQK